MAAGRDLATMDQDACVRVAVMLTIYNQKAYHIMHGSSSNSSSDEESAKSDGEEQPLEEEIITEDDFYFTTYDIP